MSWREKKTNQPTVHVHNGHGHGHKFLSSTQMIETTHKPIESIKTDLIIIIMVWFRFYSAILYTYVVVSLNSSIKCTFCHLSIDKCKFKGTWLIIHKCFFHLFQITHISLQIFKCSQHCWSRDCPRDLFQSLDRIDLIEFENI